ncbi:Clavaminate synthase-like protein [Trichoderma sp. SZMC 28014]
MAYSTISKTNFSVSMPGAMNVIDAAASRPNQTMSELTGAINGPLAWSGDEFKSEKAYILQLHAEELQEVDAALQSFKTLCLDGDEVAQGNFPLPKLAPQLAQCAATIHQGRGFFVLRGLDQLNYSVEDSTIIYLGIASYIGDKRGLQDKKGTVLTHVTNSKLWTVPAEKRHGIHSSQALPYHNDMGCDILALQVRHGAEKGGYTYLSSATTAFNELLSEAPSAALALITPEWPVQISGREPNYYLAPALTIHEGKLMASMDPNRFGPHPSYGSSNVPSLTAAQLLALDKISNAAYRTELRLDLKTGDILFFNNWALLHRRDAYTDGDETSRHMVRLWLRNSELGWSVPDSLLQPWFAAYGENGVRERLYPLVPAAEYKLPKYSAGSAAFVIED